MEFGKRTKKYFSLVYGEIPPEISDNQSDGPRGGRGEEEEEVLDIDDHVGKLAVVYRSLINVWGSWEIKRRMDL